MSSNRELLDHLFRHQFGKMVSILTRIFGLAHLETIEDAVQDTFVRASVAWRAGPPENPEAWLTAAAKNRTIDLFRKLKSESDRAQFFNSGPSSVAINEMFLDSEVADGQLRMIFTACHPTLDPRDQIAFALRTISGFSGPEIASALLLKPETVKKRLTRARAAVRKKDIQFEIPQGAELAGRLDRVLEVLYLIFNEGFHSSRRDRIVRKDLCGEALRLTKIVREHKTTRTPEVHALFALMCFHSARLDSKVGDDDLLIDLRDQDRSRWHHPLVALGNSAMYEATTTNTLSAYHFEAAIAAEHLRAPTFEATNWDRMLNWYQQLEVVQPSVFNRLNMAVINLQRGEPELAREILEAVDPGTLGQRAYLFHGCFAEYFSMVGDHASAVTRYDEAIRSANNEAEQLYLEKKRTAANARVNT